MLAILLFTAASVCAGCARSDAEVRDDIAARLAANPATSGLEVAVNVRRRIVFLTGRTDTPEEQQRVLDAAEAVEGVLLVVNDIALRDTALAGRVKAALAADPALAGIAIEVDAQNGAVRLTSDATNAEQRQRAVQVASAVDGVAHVEDRMK